MKPTESFCCSAVPKCWNLVLHHTHTDWSTPTILDRSQPNWTGGQLPNCGA
uniref:Uncharacterized protein n=1 Tax=Triticum urartu TaxID=4572 RepID=A0A8R7QDH0_TRIUA